MFASEFDGRSAILVTQNVQARRSRTIILALISKADSGVHFRYYAESEWRSVHYWTFSGLNEWVDGGSGECLPGTECHERTEGEKPTDGIVRLRCRGG